MLIFIPLLMLLFGGCGGQKSAQLESVSPDGQTKLIIDFTRRDAMDAWAADMKVNAYSWKEGSLHVTELYMNDVSGGNVVFNWQDTHHCSITFKLNDNTVRKFELVASPNQLQLGEV